MMEARKLGLFFGALLLLSPTALRAEVFQWVDNRGVIHFTDNLHSVPVALRASPVLIVREGFDIKPTSSDVPTAQEIVTEEPVPEPKAPEKAGAPEPETSQAAPPIIYNPQYFNIVVINSPIVVRRPKDKVCLIPEGCRGVFRPSFNDRRYIHPSVFDGGSRQYIQPK